MPGGGCRAVCAASAGNAARAAKKRKAAADAAKKQRKAASSDAASSDEEAPSVEEEEKEPEKQKSLIRRVVGSVMDFLDQTWLQALQYILFLFTFQSLVGTLRKPEEFYLDKFVSDTFIDNTFDSNHNTLSSIRRVADIWEWTNTVITPGLFSNADAGEWWPDGDGSFHLEGATPLSTSNIVDDQNSFDFTRGIVFKQVRANAQVGRECYAGHVCYDDRSGLENPGNKTAFGYGAAEGHFKYWSAEELGSSTLGVSSAAPISLRTFNSGGFVAIFMPFFSSTYLPDEEGTHDEVTDYRHTEARLENGVAPTYWCARYTTNGYHYVQKCNPDPGANSVIVRRMFFDMVDFLKKGHWIDTQTRMVTMSIQIRNNNAGVRYICRLMFEVTQMSAILPSFDMEAMVDDPESYEQMKLYMFMALVLTGYFMFLEGVEVAGSGLSEYFSNIWNVMDWANFVLFFQVYQNLQSVLSLDERDALRRGYTGTPGEEGGAPNDCASKICNEFGYYDMWEISNTSRDAKFYMSICVCIQLLKIIKFTNVIVPKMSLMTSVLSKGCYDLLFFGIIFSLSMFAFCMLFYIQLGSFMDDFYSQPSSLIALAKALFGDFPFEEIMDNSRGYTNGILFLVYLFVAVFILLSMFLAILGEAQAAVRESEQQEREEGKAENPYGMLGEAKDNIGKFIAKIKAKTGRGGKGGGDDDGEGGGGGDDESDGDPFEMQMQTAMTKLQAKLDSSLKQRMSGLEVRLLKELGRMEAKLRADDAHPHHTATPSKGASGGGGFGGGSATRAKASAIAEIKSGSKGGSNGKSGGSAAASGGGGGDAKSSSASKMAREASRAKASGGGGSGDKSDKKDRGDGGKVSDMGSDTEGEGPPGPDGAPAKKKPSSGDKTRPRGDRPARTASTSPAPGASGGEKEGKGSGEKEKRKKLNVAKGDLTVSPPASPKANPALAA